MTKTVTLPTLSEGDTGPEVRWAQYLLVRRTMTYDQIDGVFGPVTREAVREFQGYSDLVVDGVIGQRTWTALNGDRERPPTLARGVDGIVVQRLQTAMNVGRGEITPEDAPEVTVDGEFGPKTEAAVTAMQAFNFIAADGVVGMATWAIPVHAAGQVLASICGVPGPG